MPAPTLPGAQLRFASMELAKRDALSRPDLVRLAASERECIVRVTGGAALMDRQATSVGLFLADALGGSTCDAAVIAGATMSVDRPATAHCQACDKYRAYCQAHARKSIEPKPGVMEVLVHLHAIGAPARTIGIVPTIKNISLYAGYMVVENNPQDDYYTVIDERCPFCLVLQFSVDKQALTWDAEWQVSLDYMELLRNDAQHRSLHLVFNGGQTTRNECLHVAALPPEDNPWNILLVEDSGRQAEQLANDLEFRREHPYVFSCRKDELKTVLSQMGFAPDAQLQKVGK